MINRIRKIIENLKAERALKKFLKNYWKLKSKGQTSKELDEFADKLTILHKESVTV